MSVFFLINFSPQRSCHVPGD